MSRGAVALFGFLALIGLVPVVYAMPVPDAVLPGGTPLDLVESVFVPMAVDIVAPVGDEVLSGVYTFAATVTANDEMVGVINWSVAAGDCEAADVVVAGSASDDVSTFSEGRWSATVDMSD